MENRTFIKVSGDLYQNPVFLDFVSSIAEKDYTVICVGGGTQINQALVKEGYTLTQHGPLGRELATQKEKEIANSVLESNKKTLEEILKKFGISAKVTIPVFFVEGIMCHLNGDEYLRSVYLGFDRLYLVTRKERKMKKQKEFPRDKFPKLEVVGI
jgi:hypothetical protein